MKMGLKLGLIAALLAGTLGVYGYPNLLATTGVYGTPTSDVTAPGLLHGAVDLVTFEDTLLNGRVMYGVTDRLEVGGIVLLGRTTGLGASAKYRIATTTGNTRWALGGTVLTATNRAGGGQLFVTATRAIASEVQGTAGVALSLEDNDSALRPFVNAQFFPSARTEIAAEYEFAILDIFNKDAYSLLLRYRLQGAQAVEIGLTNVDGFSGSDHTVLMLGGTFPLGE